MKISRIIGREIYDSRGWPTVQCELTLDNGETIISSVPSGKSVSSFEAVELRDGGDRLRGKGVLKAIENLEQLAPLFVGSVPRGVDMDLRIIEVDGTADKSKIGANASLALSMALYKAEAVVEGLSLFELIAYVMDADTVTMPFPMINVINGGAHASNALRIQEFMIVPVGAPSFRSAFEAAVLVYHELHDILQEHNKTTCVGDEGGFASQFTDDLQALDILVEALERVNGKHSHSSILALDVAASQFYDPVDKLYTWGNKKLTSSELISFYETLTEKYPIYSIEDGLSEMDIDGWKQMYARLENKVQLVGDDLFATNIHRIAAAVDENIANSVIIKPNQVGTITEALQAIELCKSVGFSTIVSHRSGETEDTFIADLAVGASAGQIKAGACCRGERLAKYNRLLAIEDTLSFALLDS